MTGWLDPIVPHVKALHIAALVLWCAGLFAMPALLARHDPAIGQADYSRIRLACHLGYTWLVTPAAVFAIAAGTLLIFLEEVFAVWMFAKLAFVAMLIAFHAWVGNTIVRVADSEGGHQTPAALLPTLVLLIPFLAILFLVLAKPDLERIPLPDWLMEPRGGQLPFDVPRL